MLVGLYVFFSVDGLFSVGGGWGHSIDHVIKETVEDSLVGRLASTPLGARCRVVGKKGQGLMTRVAVGSCDGGFPTGVGNGVGDSPSSVSLAMGATGEQSTNHLQMIH